MRKYENVDVPATLGAVMEVNTEHYKSDFRYDMEMFSKAARQPDGENNHLLWLSRRSGTECVTERNAYISGTHANHAWSYYAGQTDRVQAFAVTIKGMESGHIVGDIYELDYKSHVREIQKDAQPAVAISLKFADGAEMKMPYKDYDKQRDSLIYEHGKIVSLRHEPQDESAVRSAILAARKERESEARPAAFKVRVQNQKKPSIRKQLAEGRVQLDKTRAAVSPAILLCSSLLSNQCFNQKFCDGASHVDT